MISFAVGDFRDASDAPDAPDTVLEHSNGVIGTLDVDPVSGLGNAAPAEPGPGRDTYASSASAPREISSSVTGSAAPGAARVLTRESEVTAPRLGSSLSVAQLGIGIAIAFVVLIVLFAVVGGDA